MKFVVVAVILFAIFSIVKDTNIDVGETPVSKYIVEDVKYKPCLFTVTYSPGMTKSKIYKSFDTETLPLNGLESLSEKSCKCVEDALKVISDGNQQFNYAETPHFLAKMKNKKFDIKVRVKGYEGEIKELNFNKIAQDNKYDICGKWIY